MRNPEALLNSLWKQSLLSGYKFEKLYRILFNEKMFHVAYQRIYAKTGNMTAGSDDSTIDSMSLPRIEKIIDALQNESYQPHPSRRIYILKKNGKKRPLGIPSFDDKLVQEVIRMVLETLYEPQFANSSHGFRPRRSCHTALMQVQNRFTGVKWFIEGDIEGFFDNIHHNVLIEMMRERIKDERFLRLIRKFLKAGYLEDWKFHRTFSGTPQGGIISPILSNIYLNQLDKYIEQYILQFDKGKKRAQNESYFKLSRIKAKLSYKINSVKNEPRKAMRIHQIRQIEEQRRLLPTGDEMDSGYKRIKYVRYADDFILGVVGDKADCERIKEDIKIFLDEKLKLRLSDSKTLITHGRKPARFLGYEIYVRKSNHTKRGSKGRLRVSVRPPHLGLNS